MNISQAPCLKSASACTVKSVANGQMQTAYWMGAHAQTAGCFLYGVIEVEAAVSPARRRCPPLPCAPRRASSEHRLCP